MRANLGKFHCFRPRLINDRYLGMNVTLNREEMFCRFQAAGFPLTDCCFLWHVKKGNDCLEVALCSGFDAKTSCDIFWFTSVLVIVSLLPAQVSQSLVKNRTANGRQAIWEQFLLSFATYPWIFGGDNDGCYLRKHSARSAIDLSICRKGKWDCLYPCSTATKA